MVHIGKLNSSENSYMHKEKGRKFSGREREKYKKQEERDG